MESRVLNASLPQISELNKISEETDVKSICSLFSAKQEHILGLEIQELQYKAISDRTSKEMTETSMSIDMLRYKYSADNLDLLKQNIADVLIGIKQLQLMYMIDDEDIQDLIDLKIKKKMEGMTIEYDK